MRRYLAECELTACVSRPVEEDICDVGVVARLPIQVVGAFL